MIRAFILIATAFGTLVLPTLAQVDERASYKSPYSISLSFGPQDLLGDLMKGARSDPKEQSSVSHRDWSNPGNHRRWGYWGPPARHYSAPAGLGTRSADWMRQRVIATGMSLVGHSYQHHHIPAWEPSADWPVDADQKTPVGRGLDCSNYTSFVYNLALGIKPTSAVGDQAEVSEVPGPGEGRTTPVQRIDLPESYEAFPEVLKTGDLLFVNSTSGNVSHVVLWVGAMGKSPDGVPLVLDSTGLGGTDANGQPIPDGIYLRPFKPTTWYFTQASHAIRIIADDDA